MNAWLTDTPNLTNNDHASFNGIDPSVAFLQPSQNTIDPSQFQNQRYLNGNTRNASPAFQNPQYQVPSVVPSKRPRPQEDSLATSPRQAPGGIPSSRSQTPHQVPYPGYQPNTNGAQNFSQAPNPYHHLQHTASANATPSPIMNNQQFAGIGQRVQTASPSPFSPAHHGGPQMSPHSDHASRVNTPQNAGAFMPGGPFAQGFNQQYPQQAMTSGGAQGSMPAQFNNMAQQMSAQQRAYQLQIQQQARQLQAQQAGARPSSSGMNAMNNAAQMANPQMAAIRQQMQQNMQRPNNPQTFIRQLQNFMGARGMPVDINPLISGRSVDPVTLYGNVVKKGGFNKVTRSNMWASVAEDLGFPGMQYPTAGQEFHNYFMRNMAPFEQAWNASRQKLQEASHMQQRSADLSAIQNQMSPVKSMNTANHEPNLQFQSQPQAGANVMKPMERIPNNVNQIPTNGFSTPQPKPQLQQPPPFNQRSSSLSHTAQVTPPNGQSQPFTAPSPVSAAKRLGSSSGKPPEMLDQPSTMPAKQPIEDPFRPAVFQESNLHGPIDVAEIFDLTSELIEMKPTVPTFQELGVIDVHALTMSIKSGIHAEVRMALDTLTVISVEQRMQLTLDHCDDLVETLVDCAQDQVDLLAENAAEVSDAMSVSSYEDVIRGCRTDAETLLDIPEFGSLEYDLDRAADRLICITTILRNLSFYESNFQLLGIPEVVKFLSTVIRYLGTQNMLLRSYRNTLDFMKDVVVYLSNLSHSINLPGKEEALCLLHFLLSFAPCPPPTPSADGKIMFSTYNPAVHKYMPSAVDSLAKLLARDDPNRTFYKSIFAGDASSSPPYDLLTRTFALSIAPVPEQARGNIIATVETRKPFLLQGMLAAEILSNLAPGPEHGLARTWLESSDGFALSLLRLVCMLSANRTAQAVPQQRHHPQNPRVAPPETDANAYGAISHRGLAVLRKLGEKSKSAGPVNGEAIDGNVKDHKSRMPFWVLPKKESVLGALLTHDIDPYVVGELCGYAGLDN